MDQRLKNSETNFISSINKYVPKNPNVNDFFIDLGLCLLASLPINFVSLFFFSICYDFHAHEPMQGFSPYLDSKLHFFFQLSCAPSYCHFSFTLQNENNVVIFFFNEVVTTYFFLCWGG